MGRLDLIEKARTFYNESANGDCRLRAFSQVSSFYGERIKEENLFGLGAGLCLRTAVIPFKGQNFPALVGRTEDLEAMAFRKLGYKVDVLSYDPCSLQQGTLDPTIKDALKENRPVLMECNVKKLSYVNNPNIGDNSRHIIMILKYEEEAKGVIVIDSLTNKIEELSLDNLILSHKDTGGEDRETVWYNLYPPRNKLENIENIFLQSFIELENSYKKNTKDVDDFIFFLNKMYSSVNTEGKKNYVRTLVYLNCIFIRKLDELYGTFYRSIYRIYLENIVALDIFDLEDEIKSLKCIEEDWREVSFKIRYKNKDILETTPDFIESIKKIKVAEKKLVTGLANKARKG